MSNRASSPAAWPSVRGRPRLGRPAPVAVHDAGHVGRDAAGVDAVEVHSRKLPPCRPSPGSVVHGASGRQPGTAAGTFGARDRRGVDPLVGRLAPAERHLGGHPGRPARAGRLPRRHPAVRLPRVAESAPAPARRSARVVPPRPHLRTPTRSTPPGSSSPPVSAVVATLLVSTVAWDLALAAAPNSRFSPSSVGAFSNQVIAAWVSVALWTGLAAVVGARGPGVALVPGRERRRARPPPCSSSTPRRCSGWPPGSSWSPWA